MSKPPPTEPSDSRDFYKNLRPLESFLDVTEVAKYERAPDDWSLVITDVSGSTKAIEEGRYKDVNATGVASIVAAQNALKGVEFPFVFGGDGATLLVPNFALDKLVPALRGTRQSALAGFGLSLRIGIVPIAELMERGHEVLVARMPTSPHASFAMLAGEGVAAAEKWVKDLEVGARYAIADEGPTVLDHTGFECRWQPLPARRGQVASILVHALGDAAHAHETYRQIVLGLEAVVQGASPVNLSALHLASNESAFHQEAALRGGKPGSMGYRKRRFVAGFENRVGRRLMLGRTSFAGFDGGRYPQQVVLNTDYRKFDDTLRMVLDVTAEELARIEALLLEGQQKGSLVYGIHLSDAALMTCIVRKYEGEHVHFIDGAGGGYALAAKQMKARAS